MGQLVVGIADLKVSGDPADSIVTYALGSCIAVVVHDPVRKVGGMLHYMLPQAASCPDKARENPAMVGELGIPLLLQEMARRGAHPRTLVVKAAGGAKRWDDKGAFDIGARNHTILRKMLWRHGLLAASEDVGGTRSRTVRLEVGTGAVTIRSEGEEWQL